MDEICKRCQSCVIECRTCYKDYCGCGHFFYCNTCLASACGRGSCFNVCDYCFSHVCNDCKIMTKSLLEQYEYLICDTCAVVINVIVKNVDVIKLMVFKYKSSNLILYKNSYVSIHKIKFIL